MSIERKAEAVLRDCRIRKRRKRWTARREQRTKSEIVCKQNEPNIINKFSDHLSALSATEIHRQTKNLIPAWDMSPIRPSQSILTENIDVLNYDFSFRSPFIKC